MKTCSTKSAPNCGQNAFPALRLALMVGGMVATVHVAHSGSPQMQQAMARAGELAKGAGMPVPEAAPTKDSKGVKQ